MEQDQADPRLLPAPSCPFALPTRPKGDSTTTSQQVACVTCSLLTAVGCNVRGDRVPRGRKYGGKGWREGGVGGQAAKSPGTQEPPPDGPQGTQETWAGHAAGS